MPSFLQSLRNRFNRTFRGVRSRHRAVESLKTLALVCPLTLLIWVLAERASLSTGSAEVVFEVALTDPNLDATITDPGDKTLKLQMSGPRARLDALKAELANRSKAGPVRFPVETKYAAGSEPIIPTINLVSSDPLIEQSGVTVTFATPTNVRLSVDAIVPREIPVRLPDDAAAKVNNVVIDPPTIAVRGPQATLARLFPPENNWIVLDLAPTHPALAKTGAQQLRDVPLRVPIEKGLNVRDKVVRTVRFDVAQSESEYVIPAVAIQVLKPNRIEGSAVVRLGQKTVTNIRVRGPEDAISRLRDPGPTATPIAVLRIRPEDVGREGLRRDVEILDLPPGVTKVDGVVEVEFGVGESGAALE
ncbi:MAG TPA: hypothetical protein VF624_05650 [Tepidisphaeraceae bacterium]|jgi:hypothetical protein